MEWWSLDTLYEAWTLGSKKESDWKGRASEGGGFAHRFILSLWKNPQDGDLATGRNISKFVKVD